MMKTCDSAEPFISRGFRRQLFFPHQTIALRKAYPDTFLQLKKRGIAEKQATRLTTYQINVYSPRIEDFPAELFTDPVVNWHGQQFGRPGLVASAGVVIDRDALYVSILQSDLCQQIAKHPALKKMCASRIDNRFGHWYDMLFNAVLDFAIDQGLQHVYSPTSAQIVGTTPKSIDSTLFFKIYDSCQSRYELRREQLGRAEYWHLEVARNADKIVRLEPTSFEPRPRQPPLVICIFHDIEEDVDTKVSPDDCHAALLRMLEIERELGVTATYNILGQLFARKASLITANAPHSIAFHTYNHQLDSLDQLVKLRGVDYQVKGYRTARSIITKELTDYALSFRNFEWLMSSARSFGFDLPRLENGIVKIPVHLDDYPLSTGDLNYSEWMSRVIELTGWRSFVAIGLHDCYSKFWIDKYGKLLERLKGIGELWTCDQIMNRVYLADSCEMEAATAL
jgi:hypothetical protein